MGTHFVSNRFLETVIMSEKWGHRWAFLFACFFSMWGLLMALLIACPIVGAHSFSFKTPTGTSVSDFLHFYQCGVMSLSEQRHQIYDPAVQLEFTNRLIAPDHIERVFYIEFVPFMFPMMIPLTMLPLERAYSLWYLLSVGAGLSAVYFLIKSSNRFGKLETFTILSAAFASAPSIVCLAIGQSSYLLLAFLALFSLAVRYRKDVLAGLSLTLFSIKPQYLPVWGIALIAIKRWKTLFTCAVFELLFLGASIPVIGLENIINYPNVILQAQKINDASALTPENTMSVCVRGLFSQFIPDSIVVPLGLVCFLSGIVLIFLVWQRTEKKLLSQEWAVALTTVLSLTVSLHCHIYDLLLMTIPAVMTLPKLSFTKAFSIKDMRYRIWCLLLLVYPVVTWIIYCLKIYWPFALFNLALLAAGITYAFSTEAAKTENQSQN